MIDSFMPSESIILHSIATTNDNQCQSGCNPTIDDAIFRELMTDPTLCCDEIVSDSNLLLQHKYEECRKSWNRAIDKYPSLILYCNSQSQVISCIQWIRRKNINILQHPIRIRSGSHSYEGFSTDNKAIVIDVSRIKNISLNEHQSTVTIGAGGQFVFPGGACPSVGVVGYSLGGGWSFVSRAFGLGCDNIMELEMIDFNGNILQVNEHEHADLFWACRGAGNGNFGVITSMTLRVHRVVPSHPMASLIMLNYSHCCPVKMASMVNSWQDIMNQAPSRFNGKINMYHCGKDGIGFNLIAVLLGEKQEAVNCLQDFLSKCPDEPGWDTGGQSSCVATVEYMPIHEVFKAIGDIHPEYETFKSSGRFASRDFTLEEIQNFINIVQHKPQSSIYAAISLYGLGGVIHEVPKEHTAFAYRDAKSIIGIQTQWKDSKLHANENSEWVVEMMKNEIIPLTCGSFINFPLLELEDYKKEYFGSDRETLQRLERVKNKYDPLRVFTFPQSL
ncbi:hypothetical protein C9374_013774 [Naegleria lovaniensis]|uniref:FAD-binding PCMH-type domain-containing protein n=1 Tax=Naegleria lovaniensis TaxID=51637 RepID=A0AA88GBC7_NAELO|nr:uncharacterized protein C9374_013774 [Naegleria lovaniensis]KAG2370863.1 hypothetical protein C9374_013774 [Naegleria lovaniensis]